MQSAYKRCMTQLDGIAVAEKLLRDIVCNGFAGIDDATYKQLRDSVISLGDYFIPGIRSQAREFLYTLSSSHYKVDYTIACEKAVDFYSLLKKSREYIQAKAIGTQDSVTCDADSQDFAEGTCAVDAQDSGESTQISEIDAPNACIRVVATDALASESTDLPTVRRSSDMRLDTDIEERIGTAWHLTDLDAMGLYRENDELLQLSFQCLEDKFNQFWLYEGIWFSLSRGELFYTRDYRPYAAERKVKPTDSCFDVMLPERLYIYPGSFNQRIRWKDANKRRQQSGDLVTIAKSAQCDFSQVINEVRKLGLSPLGTRNPIFLLRMAGLVKGGDSAFAIYDRFGTKLALDPTNNTRLLGHFARSSLEGQILLGRFVADIAAGTLCLDPLTLINDAGILRLCV